LQSQDLLFIEGSPKNSYYKPVTASLVKGMERCPLGFRPCNYSKILLEYTGINETLGLLL